MRVVWVGPWVGVVGVVDIRDTKAFGSVSVCGVYSRSKLEIKVSLPTNENNIWFFVSYRNEEVGNFLVRCFCGWTGDEMGREGMFVCDDSRGVCGEKC